VSRGPVLPSTTVASYLDEYLRIREVPDEPNAVNGLQVENRGGISQIVAAVDASQATIDQVAQSAAEGTLILVHHGLFWDGNVPLTGRRYRRVHALLDRDIALYSAHIPLDIPPEVGNNVALARLLGMPVDGWFGDYRGVPIGVHGLLALQRDALVATLNQLLPANATLIPGGSEVVARLGIISGGAGNMITHARNAGIDTYLTGEGAHHTWFDAMEWGINLIYAGHYATEKLGVQRLAQHLSDRFELPWEFHDHDTGL
jgi:dinuclear metal center YbgI/SA1388 family protein